MRCMKKKKGSVFNLKKGHNKVSSSVDMSSRPPVDSALAKRPEKEGKKSKSWKRFPKPGDREMPSAKGASPSQVEILQRGCRGKAETINCHRKTPEINKKKETAFEGRDSEG